MPKISVALLTYNHEKYISYAIQSIINQTFKDFELIIINDGSTDKTEQIIKTFSDSRIKYFYQTNQGPSAAINNAVLTASGQYIMLMSGDDIAKPTRIEQQYNYFLDNPTSKIVFSNVDFIDDDNQPLIHEKFDAIFNHHQLNSKTEAFKYLFFMGNYLNAPSCMLEKIILLQEGLFNLASIQLQDFDMWLKLVKKYDLHIMQEKLLMYRIRKNEMNLSDRKNVVRINFEFIEIMRNVFNDISSDFFKQAFRNELIRADFSDKIEFELEKAFLYLKHSAAAIKNLGIQKLFTLMQDEKVIAIAKTKYSFNLQDFFKLTANDQWLITQERAVMVDKYFSPHIPKFKKLMSILYLLAVTLTPGCIKNMIKRLTKNKDGYV